MENPFDIFWQEYPRRVAKISARKAFDAALRTTPAEEIIAGAKKYAASVYGKEFQFIAHPATWLRAGRWEDDYPDSDVFLNEQQQAPENEIAERMIAAGLSPAEANRNFSNAVLSGNEIIVRGEFMAAHINNNYATQLRRAFPAGVTVVPCNNGVERLAVRS